MQMEASPCMHMHSNKQDAGIAVARAPLARAVVAVPGVYGLRFTNGVEAELRAGWELTAADGQPLVIQDFVGRE